MTSFVNTADAIVAAVEIERRGHSFYVQAREKAENPKDKDFFASMAEEEKRHEEIFLDMLRRVGGIRLLAESIDQEYLDYLTAMFYHHSLFVPDLERILSETPLHAAMQCEKDSLLFFLEMDDLIPEAEKRHVRACVDEKRRHLKLLSKIRHLK